MSDSKTPSPPEIDPKLVRDLARILRDTDLTEVEVERGELRIRVARTVTMTAAPVAQAMPAVPAASVVAAAPAPVAVAAPSSVASPAAGADWANHPGTVPSPMVGTVYLQAEPGAPPFVRLGDTVGEGQTVLIIEAMKTMNPIPAPRGGKVLAILVDDTDPVEFGEPLIVIG